MVGQFEYSNMENNFYVSSNLIYVASVLLQKKGIRVAKVDWHPQKSGVKNFYLQPAKDAEQMYLDFVSGILKVSANDLSNTIENLKHLPVNDTKNDFYSGNVRT